MVESSFLMTILNIQVENLWKFLFTGEILHLKIGRFHTEIIPSKNSHQEFVFSSHLFPVNFHRNTNKGALNRVPGESSSTYPFDVLESTMKIINFLFAIAVAGRYGQRRHFRKFHHHKRVQKSDVPLDRAMKWVNGRIYEWVNYDQIYPDTKVQGNIKDFNPMNLYIKNLIYS